MFRPESFLSYVMVLYLGISAVPASAQLNWATRVPAMTLLSSDLSYGKPMSADHTADGRDISPQLYWQNIPRSAKELAIIMEDPDAPSAEPWVHWVLYKIPATIRRIPQGIPPEGVSELPGILQGKNSWGTIGYRGPLPPKGHGAHHYKLVLYALSEELTLPAGASKHDLLAAIKDTVVASTVLLTTYMRP